METEKIENQKKQSFEKTLDELLERLEKDEENLKQLQEKFNKQKKEIRKWLSLMG
jgi:hypothetical protein